MTTHKDKMRAHELGREIALVLGYDANILRWQANMYHWATSDDDPLPQWWMNTDAALMLCAETGWLLRIAVYSSAGVYVSLSSSAPGEIVKARGDTLAEALCRVWLKLKAIKGCKEW